MNAAQQLKNENIIIEGYFKRQDGFMRENAIKKVNNTLCTLLGVFIVVAFVSYYMSMTYELTLNTLSRQISTLNDENTDLQNDLDKLKSFSNVDTKINQLKLLQKADKVIEVSAVASAAPVEKKQLKSTYFNWSIGY
jgi:cell division protein FtsL